MTSITCYQTDDNGVFIYALLAYPFPMEERINVPYQAVRIALPEIPEGKRARWVSPLTPMEPNYESVGEWVIEDIPPAPADPEQPE